MSNRTNAVMMIKESKDRVTFSTNFTTLNTRQIPIYANTQPNTTDVFILICVTTHAHNANPVTHKPNFMMIPEGREFCFNMFFPFLIIMTFFFMRHPSGRSFLFHRATRGIVFSVQAYFFVNKYARRTAERG